LTEGISEFGGGFVGNNRCSKFGIIFQLGSLTADFFAEVKWPGR